MTSEDLQVKEGIKAYDVGDYEKAKNIIVPLAEKGHSKAMSMLGYMHDFGKAFPINHALACDWYEKAAKAGDRAAQLNLGVCYSKGIGRPQNDKKWIFWMTKAGEQGDKDAQADIAAHYVDTDKDKFMYWAKKAAANGSVRAKILLWSTGSGDLVPDLTWGQRICGLVMIGWLDKEFDYCD